MKFNDGSFFFFFSLIEICCPPKILQWFYNDTYYIGTSSNSMISANIVCVIKHLFHFSVRLIRLYINILYVTGLWVILIVYLCFHKFDFGETIGIDAVRWRKIASPEKWLETVFLRNVYISGLKLICYSCTEFF